MFLNLINNPPLTLYAITSISHLATREELVNDKIEVNLNGVRDQGELELRKTCELSTISVFNQCLLLYVVSSFDMQARSEVFKC